MSKLGQWVYISYTSKIPIESVWNVHTTVMWCTLNVNFELTRQHCCWLACQLVLPVLVRVHVLANFIFGEGCFFHLRRRSSYFMFFFLCQKLQFVVLFSHYVYHFWPMSPTPTLFKWFDAYAKKAGTRHLDSPLTSVPCLLLAILAKVFVIR